MAKRARRRGRRDIVEVIDLPPNRRVELVRELDGNKRVVRARVRGQTVLDKYLNRKLIDASQFAAGERMAKLYHVAGLHGIRAQSLEKIDPSPGEWPDRLIEAKRVFLADLARLEPRGASIVLAVACEDKTAGEWARGHGVRREYAIERLREALSEIARAHGL